MSEPVRWISREQSRFAHRSRAEVVTIALADGTVVRRFVKWLMPDGHPDKRRRDREPNVLRHLLEPARRRRRAPVPRFRGVYRDAEANALVVVLDYVDGWPLKYHDVGHWTTAARELARLHALFAPTGSRLRRRDFLLRLDRDYFRAWAARAPTAVAARAPGLDRRVRRVLRDHDAIAELLAAQPPTLVHNDLAPKNVVVETSRDPARIWLVDWEMAGVGCGLLDLAHLLHGLGTVDREAVASAYWSELTRTGSPLAVRNPDRVLAACEVQSAIFRLAHVGAWGLEPAAVADRVEELERLRQELPGR